VAPPPARCRPDGTAATNPVVPCLSKAVDTPSGSSAANAKTPRLPTRVSAVRPGLSYPHRGGARDKPRQRVQPGAGAPPPPAVSILTPEDPDDSSYRGHPKPIAAQRWRSLRRHGRRRGRGQVKTGTTVSHEVEPGTHDVKVHFAKTGWQVPNPKTSPTMTYTVGDSETLVVNVSLGPANSPGMTAPTEEDWLSLTAEGESGRNQTAQRSTSARTFGRARSRSWQDTQLGLSAFTGARGIVIS